MPPEKCIICGKSCNSKDHYEGWTALCSEKCFKIFIKKGE